MTKTVRSRFNHEVGESVEGCRILEKTVVAPPNEVERRRGIYDYLVEGTVRRVEPHYGPKWIKWITDIPVSLHVLAQRRLSVSEYVNDLKGDVVSCEWDRSDPLPFFLQIVLLPYLILRRGY